MADEEPVDPINRKTCILRASIHCEGCKRKVKKILSQLHGVEYVDVDSKQQKVTVVGNVDAAALINKLAKSGKKAELWPQIDRRTDEIPANTGKKKGKEKEIESPAEAPSSSDNSTPLEASTEVEADTKNSQGIGAPVKATGPSVKPNGGGGGGGGDARAVTGPSVKPNGGGGGGGGDARADTGPSVKPNGDVPEKKLEDESKSEESCSVIKEKEAVEKINGGGGGNGGESGTCVKKKKKKGQSGNPAPNAHKGLENRESGPLQGTNESPPRNHNWPPPPALQPVYAVSYNTAYPSSSYTSSYYSEPPPHAYAYVHPARGMEPPPLDPEMNPRQALDSFEIFSDENPNGCFIM